MIKVFFCARCSLLSAPWARDTMPEYYDSDEVEDEDRIDAEPEPESPATPLTVPKSTRTRPRATLHFVVAPLLRLPLRSPRRSASTASDRAPDVIRPI